MLFNKTRHNNIKIIDKIIFFKYRTRQFKANSLYKWDNLVFMHHVIIISLYFIYMFCFLLCPYCPLLFV